MKPGARVALGVGIGYFLGRTKKMRLAMMLAGAGVTGKLPSNPQELLQRSASMLGSSPEINKITESVRGELMHAARAAAVTAASHRIDALNERLQARSSGAGGGADEEPEDAEYEDEYDESRDGEESRGGRSRRSRTRDEEPDYDETDEEGADEEDSGAEDAEDSGDEEESEPERPAPRRRATSRPRASRSKKTSDSEESDDSEEATPKPRKRAARSSASSSGRAPVRRTKR
ncbi:hypothetical protein [Rhodococcus sp. B50]|uniref:hypothetical protein n=1 Tax=Rhodococcus sp. B50 TaxID=2682847 RepID=UPI0019D9F67A|nr:hypothetical protein [Rhodococcus sp. B50]MBS9374627.1 hypothetical protein [Rhodococcus sp. B50]